VKSLTQVLLDLLEFLFVNLASGVTFSGYCESTTVIPGAPCQCHNTPDRQADNHCEKDEADDCSWVTLAASANTLMPHLQITSSLDGGSPST
jgi:hypothetical protein